MPGVEPVAVPVRGERARELEAEGYAVVSTIDEAARAGATACVVATDTGRHVDDGLSALESEMDLLVEKPLAVDAWAARDLCIKAGEARKRLFVGCVLRFWPSLREVRRLLPRIGRVHAARIECQSWLPDWRPERAWRESYSARAADGGVLRDLVHEIDYAGWLLGWPRAVSARLTKSERLGIEAEDAADLLWETPGGCAVSVRLDYLSKPARRGAVFAGEQGTLEWNGMAGSVVLAVSGGTRHEITLPVQRDAALTGQARAFLFGDDENLATGEQGVLALAVCDAARRASAGAREEEVVVP